MKNPHADADRDLARDLISRSGEIVGQIEVGPREARALVRVSPGESPVEVVVDLGGLHRFIGSAAQDARDLFPDVDPVEGGLRLISVHLWEEVESADVRVLAVGVGSQGETWRRTEPAPPRGELPPGDYHWTAGREGFESQ